MDANNWLLLGLTVLGGIWAVIHYFKCERPSKFKAHLEEHRYNRERQEQLEEFLFWLHFND
jgi:hypothetical protein